MHKVAKKKPVAPKRKRPVFIHRYAGAPGAPVLPRDVFFPTLITLDGNLPGHLARFGYAVEMLN